MKNNKNDMNLDNKYLSYEQDDWGNPMQIPYDMREMNQAMGINAEMPYDMNYDVNSNYDMGLSCGMCMNSGIGMGPVGDSIAFNNGMSMYGDGSFVMNVPGMPETLTNPIYTPAFLRKHIGKLIKVEFLVGDNITERIGRLNDVGASYILLESPVMGSSVMCDINSIKFVTIVQN